MKTLARFYLFTLLVLVGTAVMVGTAVLIRNAAHGSQGASATLVCMGLLVLVCSVPVAVAAAELDEVSE